MEIFYFYATLGTVAAACGVAGLFGRKIGKQFDSGLQSMTSAMQKNGNETHTKPINELRQEISVLTTDVSELKRAMASLDSDARRYLAKGAQALRRAKERDGLIEEEEVEPEPSQVQAVLNLEANNGPIVEPEPNRILSLTEISSLGQNRR
jgi:hypothetical protein